MNAPVNASAGIGALLNPSSVAIVGASDDPTRIGGRPIAYMKRFGFPGRLIPVNPKRDTVQGLPAFPSLDDVDGTVDFALIAVPAAHVAEAVRAAARKGARTALIFSSDFAEAGPAGAAMQAEVAQAGREGGVRIIGPNCLGAFNAATGFVPCFSGTFERGAPTPGGLAIASQSGAYGSHIYYLTRQRRLGASYFLTTGNECDVTVGEAIGLMAADDAVHAICAYVEGVKDGAQLVESLEIARAARKPVAIMKVGRSVVGAQAASSHTASLAGEDAVYDAVLRQHGAFRVRTTEEMIDIAVAARPRIYPAGPRVGLMTISGGAGVLMADEAEAQGLDVAPMPEDVQTELKKSVPFSSPRNPVDVTAQVFNDMSLVTTFLKAMMDRGDYDSVVAFWTTVAGGPTIAGPLRDAMTKALEGHEGRLIVQSLIADPETTQRYEDAGYPVFEDPSRAVAALGALTRFGAAFAAGRPETPPVPLPEPLPEGELGEREARAILKAAGLPMAADTLATTAAEAEGAASSAGTPTVALKIASADILHKTEAGGVALNVSADEAGAAFDAMLARVRERAPDARIDGVLVSPMAPEGVDLILGARRDPVFGPVVMVGAGGVHAEVMRDIAFRRAPVTPATAREMLEELRSAPLLHGARGAAPCDLDALSAAVSALSVFAAAHADAVESVEINPLRAFPGAHPAPAMGLDALIVKG